MRKRTKALFTAVLATAGLATAPGAASASAAECTEYPHVCLWVDKDYNTSYGAWAASVSTLSPTWHGRVSSYINRLPGAIIFYSGNNYSGSYQWCVNPYTADSDLSDNYIGGSNTWNDLIKSFRYYPGGTCG